MVFHISIQYNTRPGEDLFLCGNLPCLGNDTISLAVPLQYGNGGIWTLTLPVEGTPSTVSFFFLVMKDGQITRRESKLHIYTSLPQTSDAWFMELWEPSHYAPVFRQHTPKAPGKGLISLRTHCHNVPVSSHLALVGESESTGGWEPAKGIALQPQGNGLWEVRVPARFLDSGPIAFKFVIRDNKDLFRAQWEAGDNRLLALPATLDSANGNKAFVALNTPSFRPDRASGPRYAGTAIPVFSLRSNDSWGIGDFHDLKKMADWVALTGQRVLQILPVNDTTMYNNWIDSYPYGGISIMALHPLYLHVPSLCPKEADIDLSPLEKRRKELNALPQLDYDAVSELKRKAFRIIYKATAKTIFGSEAYKTFYKENESWLRPYALFCVLRDRFGTADHTQWGAYAIYRPSDVAAFKEVKYYYFLQFHLDAQLKEAHVYIHRKGLVLKGDIPIGITPHSVEAWTTPHLFKMDMQAGAPPDDFSVNGQNWGFPTYNWEVMEKDGYRWFKNRFTHMALYFDAYRIDHILGFFRIWSIPQSQTQGLMGHFDPALPFSQEELRARGFAFDYRRMATPFLTKDLLVQRFGDQWEMVASTFLDSDGWDNRYFLKPTCDTQRKITDSARTLGLSPAITRALLSLPAEVLFVKDSDREDRFHPRISAQYTYSYQCLDYSQKEAYNRIYDHFFYHRHNDFWYRQAMKKLPELLSATQMLCCAEDLGMIPACVPSVMGELSMLSLEVQRMPKDPSQQFGDPSRYPFLSVCTTGSHDTSTLRAWWEEDRKLTRDYYHRFLRRNGEPPLFCEPDLCRRIIDAHLKSPSLLCILPWQDWMSIDGDLRYEKPQEERINIPANVPHYWRWRMHMTLEALLKAQPFNTEILKMVTVSGRGE